MLYRIAALLFVLVFAITVSAGAASFWPMFQRDQGHTGVAPVSTPGELDVLWSVDTTTGYSTHLVLGVDGSVWVVGGPVDKFSPRGENLLHILIRDFGLQGEFIGRGSPAVLPDGTLIAIAGIRNEAREFVATLFAIGPEGDLHWTLPFEGQTNPSSLISLGPEGEIYVGCPTCLYSVSPDGRIVWSYECGAKITSIPAAASDGTVYFGAGDGALYSLAAGGLLNWTFRPEGPGWEIDSTPTLDEMGHIYFAASGSGFFCLNNDGSVEWSYPISRYCYTSPILFPDGSLAFHEMTEHGPAITRLEPDGSKRWSVPVPGTTQAPLASPAADCDGNVFFTFKEFDPDTRMTNFSFARVDSEGNYTPLLSGWAVIGYAGGPCIGQDGTIYSQVGSKLAAFGRRRGTSIGIWTDSPGYAPWLECPVNVSLRITNAAIATPIDCYIAWKRPDKNQLVFYPFWSEDPSLAAMQFRPLPGNCFFENIEIAHFASNLLPKGDHKLYAAFFEPGTFNLVSDIASCKFAVFGTPTRGEARKAETTRTSSQISLNGGQMGTPPTVTVWTDKETYSAGDVLDLSLSLENQGMGMPYDLYIAATLDDDPSGTLFFFPTWQTDPSLANIAFLPLGHGASLPSWTIMHLDLPDALPRGGYRFLAAFFYHDTFDLASNVAEAHWTLM